ncbi:hypothetical protein ABPG72_008014 [Tetrahymena utriculariae]
MSSLQSKNNNQEIIQQLVKALEQSKYLSKEMKQKNEELTQELSNAQKKKESYKKQCEDQQKRIKMLQEQNQQLQQKLQQQQKVIYNLQEENKTLVSKSQSIFNNQQNGIIHDHQFSENILDEHSIDNHINQAKNFESTKPIFNKNSNIQNNNKFNFVQTPISTIQRAGENQNIISNNQNGVSANKDINPQNYQNQQPDQIYNIQNLSKGNMNNVSQTSQKNMFTFSKAIPNLENHGNADSVNNAENKLAYTSSYSAPQVQINLFSSDTQSSKQKINDKLQLNESNLSVSSSRFEQSPNNRYNGTTSSKNIFQKYEQNFLKISQNSNIFSSSQNYSPINKQTQSIANTEQNNIKIDSNITQKQKGDEIQLKFSNKKRHENVPNYTDDEDEDSEDQHNSDYREEDEFDENTSYSNNNKSILTCKQTQKKEFEIKQNMIMNTSSHSNSFNNQDTTRLATSYVLNDESNQNEPIFHQPKQMTFGITESPQLSYFRQELKGQTAQFSDPKSQLQGELNQESAIFNQPYGNYQQKKLSNKNYNLKIFNNQNQYHQRNQTAQEQPKAQENEQNLMTSQTKTRIIFEQFPQIPYSNNMNQINNQQVQISQNSQIQQIQQGIPNNALNQNNQISQSQISFNNQNQFYSNQHQQINLRNSQNLQQDDEHSQQSVFFEVGNYKFSDNKLEKQHSQIIFSTEKQSSELQGSQIKHISARRLTNQDKMQSKISNQDGYQSNLKELFPQQIKNMQDYVFNATYQQKFQNQNNAINDTYQNSNQININEPDSNFSSGLGSKIAGQQFNNINNNSKSYGSCNIQSSIESTSLHDSIQPVQKIQIKSPKNMMDITKKYQNSHKDYLNEEYISKNNLMENFFILSANQNQIKERVMTTNEVQSVKAETIYSYPKLNEQTAQIEETIHQLSFPYGVLVKQKQKTLSQSDLLQILMHDKNNMSSDQFVFTIKTIQSYEKYDNSNKNSISTLKDIVDVANPNNLLYCICVQQKTFINFKDPKQQSKSQKKLKKEFYYEVESVYCIVTKFPHIQFYLEVIENILSMVKVVKSQKLHKVDPYDMDLFFYQNLQSEIEAKLATLLKTKIPLFQINFSLPQSELDQKKINLCIKDAEYCQYIECQWGLCDSLKKFKQIKDFVQLYISLLLERSVVFVSISRSVLSQFILLFHSMLKPLKWTHAMITTLPKSLFDYLHSPTPIIIGINDTKQNLECQFKERFPDSFNIVYLDDMSFSFLKDSTFEEDSDFISILNMELEGLFDQIQGKTQIPKSKTSFDHQTDERKPQEQVENKLLRLMKQLFQDHIVEHIPKQPIFRKDNQNKNLDYSLIHEEIINSKNIPDSFLKEFFKTQIFAYYLEEYYGII